MWLQLYLLLLLQSKILWHSVLLQAVCLIHLKMQGCLSKPLEAVYGHCCLGFGFCLMYSFRTYLPRRGRLVLCMILKGNSRLPRQGLLCGVGEGFALHGCVYGGSHSLSWCVGLTPWPAAQCVRWDARLWHSGWETSFRLRGRKPDGRPEEPEAKQAGGPGEEPAAVHRGLYNPDLHGASFPPQRWAQIPLAFVTH